MAESIKVSKEIINKLRLVQEFITAIYSGEQQYKPRIAFIASTLDDVITELKGKQVKRKKGTGDVS